MTYITETKWSLFSLLLYTIMGCFFAIICYSEKKTSYLNKENKRKNVYSKYILLLFVWVVFGAFRYVDSNVGGTDAPSYIYYFENCHDPNIASKMDVCFRYINIIIRYFTGNYRIYFVLYYTFITYAMILVVKEFHNAEASSIPLCILIYLYTRSFTSMRSNLAIAFVMIALVKLSQKKGRISFLFVIIALFTHVSSFVYAGFFLFYYVYKKRNISFWKSACIIVVALIVANFAQSTILAGKIDYLTEVGTGAYASYARRSIGKNIILNYSVSNIPQLALFVTLLLLKKRIDLRIETVSQSDTKCAEKISLMRMICYYDFFVVPIIYVLGIYRGYEYFYIIRLLMWGEILSLFREKTASKSNAIINVGAFGVFVVWMIGRYDATWESSHLMPYVFSLFI